MNSSRTIPVSSLLGRRVRDAEGRSIGRIRELIAEIELHPHGSDYVVTRIVVGRFRSLDIVATGGFVPAMLQRFLNRIGYAPQELPWDAIDLSDPEHPRLRNQGVGSEG